MRFIDAYKMALHNIWQNKSRSLLTIIIVAIVSFLMMFLCVLGTSFIANQQRIMQTMFEEQGTNMRFGGVQSEVHDENKVIEIKNVLNKYSTIVDSVSMDYGYRVSFMGGHYGTQNAQFYPTDIEINNIDPRTAYFDSDFPVCADEGFIVEGRMHDKRDDGKNSLLLSIDIKRAYAQKGVSLNIGDTLSLSTGIPTSQGNHVNKTFDFTIIGIFQETNSNDNYWSRSIAATYISRDYLRELIPEVTMLSVNASYKPIAGSYSFNSEYMQFSKLDKEMTKILPVIEQYTNGYKSEWKQSYIEIVENSVMIMIMVLLIMGVILLLCLLILLLSVGSVANTIIISVDKNRKFIGLMKAMGLKHKGLKSIVKKESFIQILIGILIAVGIIFCMEPVILMIIESMFGSMFAMMGEFKVIVSIPFYIPLLVFLGFYLFANLFSKSSVLKMGKADAMSIISEVA